MAQIASSSAGSENRARSIFEFIICSLISLHSFRRSRTEKRFVIALEMSSRFSPSRIGPGLSRLTKRLPSSKHGGIRFALEQEAVVRFQAEQHPAHDFPVLERHHCMLVDGLDVTQAAVECVDSVN